MSSRNNQESEKRQARLHEEDTASAADDVIAKLCLHDTKSIEEMGVNELLLLFEHYEWGAKILTDPEWDVLFNKVYRDNEDFRNKSTAAGSAGAGVVSTPSVNSNQTEQGARQTNALVTPRSIRRSIPPARSFPPSRSCPTKGLINRGKNACFIYAVVHCLHNIPGFKDSLKKINKPIATELHNLFNQLENADEAVSPDEKFWEEIDDIVHVLDDGVFQSDDANSFFGNLVSKLYGKSDTVNHDDMFSYEAKKLKCCSGCKKNRKEEERKWLRDLDIWDIILKNKENDQDQPVQWARYENARREFCINCKDDKTQNIDQYFLSAPNVLVVVNNFRKQFPLPDTMTIGVLDNAEEMDSEKMKYAPVRYRSTSAALFQPRVGGEEAEGHYIAFRKHRNIWYKYDDEKEPRVEYAMETKVEEYATVFFVKEDLNETRNTEDKARLTPEDLATQDDFIEFCSLLAQIFIQKHLDSVREVSP